MGTPKVSVCIPVFNGEDYIGEAVESVLKQSFEDFELVVSDNCSNDSTEKVVKKFCDDRLKFIRNDKNLGPVGNSNRCLELAKGQYVYIFHHDDIMSPNNLERKVSILDKNPNVGFVHSDIQLINPLGEIISDTIWYEGSRIDYIENGKTIFKRYIDFLNIGAILFIGTVLARRFCYEKIGGFNPDFVHTYDSEMSLRMLLFFDVACIGTPLVKYRVHPLSASSSWGDYTSVAYLYEHYLMAKSVFKSCRAFIPRHEELQEKMRVGFSERALKLSADSILEGDKKKGTIFIKKAIEMYHFTIFKKNFWKACALNYLNDGAIKKLKQLKKHESFKQL